MKKILIASYFVGMLLLTYVVVKAAATYKNGPVEVRLRKIKIDLNDDEISKAWGTKDDNYEYYREYSIKETRTKKWFGWETSRDTVNHGGTIYRRENR